MKFCSYCGKSRKAGAECECRMAFACAGAYSPAQAAACLPVCTCVYIPRYKTAYRTAMEKQAHRNRLLQRMPAPFAAAVSALRRECQP